MSTIDFETLGPLVLGCVVLVIGSVAKIFLEYDRVRPGAPIGERGRILFRQLYLAPDFVLLAFGLLISARARGLPVPPPSRLATRRGLRVLVLGPYPGEHTCAVRLRFPVAVLEQGQIHSDTIGETENPRAGGQVIDRTEQSPMWIAGLFSRAGWPTLILGNLLGLISLLSYFVFITHAF